MLCENLPSVRDEMVKKHNLVHEVFYHCLFELPTHRAGDEDTPRKPKCKSGRSRQAAMQKFLEKQK